jgi:hypothetical protein
MKVFLLGTYGPSKTDSKVIITVELLPNHTDMKGITVYHGKHIVNPFYRKLRLNAGKVICIADLEEEHEHLEATIRIGGNDCTLISGNYFYLHKESMPVLDQSEYLIAYQYKVAVLEASGYKARGYTGVHYTHYETGNIQAKIYYQSGTLHSRFCYRDDDFNTLRGVRQYHDGVLDCEFDYDAREALIRQRWYDSRGNVYHTINARPNEETIDLPAAAIEKTIMVEKPVVVVDSDSESESESAESEPRPKKPEPKDDGSDDGPNLGSDIGGMRFKPRDGESDEDTGSDSDPDPES